MKSANEIREYFLTLLRNSLTHSSMYGGETVLWYCLRHLAFIDEAEEALNAEMKRLQVSGASLATGVTGGFRMVTGVFDGGAHDVASIYAEVSHRLGYLKPDRSLSSGEYRHVREGLRE